MKNNLVLAIAALLSAVVLVMTGCNVATASSQTSPNIVSSSDTTTQILAPTLSQTLTKPVLTTFDSEVSYTLTTSVPSGGGVIYVSPGSNEGSYVSGTIVTLTASADPDHAFSNWGGDASGINVKTNILMNSNKSVTAYFIPY